MSTYRWTRRSLQTRVSLWAFVTWCTGFSRCSISACISLWSLDTNTTWWSSWSRWTLNTKPNYFYFSGNCVTYCWSWRSLYAILPTSSISALKFQQYLFNYTKLSWLTSSPGKPGAPGGPGAPVWPV